MNDSKAMEKLDYGHKLNRRLSTNPTMKSCHILLITVALISGSAHAATSKAESNDVAVMYLNSEKFTDVESSDNGGTDKYYLKILKEHLQKVASRQLAPGMKLEVTITDIDLAGEFDPFHPDLRDVRIIKDIYMPRIKLYFKLIDADGTIFREGERHLTDLSFMTNINLHERSLPLFYDKALLTQWVENEFRS